MVMPNVYPALALAPQTASYIASDSPLRAYYMGREERIDDEKRNYLREAGGMAAQGNISGAVGAAFRGGDPATAMNISNWDTNRRIQAITMLREGAQRADTPERWGALVNSVERVFGPEMVGNYRDFNSRPAAMTALEQAQLRLAQSHADLYEAQAGAAGRQAENQQMFFNLLRGEPSASPTAAPPPLPMSPPAAPSQLAAAPSGSSPGMLPQPQPMRRGGIGSDVVAAPLVAAPSASTIPAPQPQAAPETPAVPAAPPASQAPAPVQAAPAQQQERRTVAQIFGSASPTEQAEILALINQNKTDDAMKRLREVEAGGAPLTARQRGESEEGLRREFAGLAKSYFDVRDAYTRIEQVAQNPSPAGDIALIFNYMKMLDPGSTVREGEFSTAQNAAGIPERVQALYNRLLSGQRLTEDQRKDFVAQSGRLMTTQERQYQSIQAQYLDIARRNGLDERNVFVDFSRPPSERKEPSPASGAAAPSGGPARIRNDVEYNSLPPGAEFVGPDGVRRKKPDAPAVPLGTP